MSDEEQGRWELDLWNGSALFSDWFRRRLPWPPEASCKKLDALRPFLAPGAWEALLLGIRALLERQTPLDLEIDVQVHARIERWHVKGVVERSPAGQPVYLAGSMRDLKDPPRPRPSWDDASTDDRG